MTDKKDLSPHEEWREDYADLLRDRPRDYTVDAAADVLVGHVNRLIGDAEYMRRRYKDHPLELREDIERVYSMALLVRKFADRVADGLESGDKP